MNKTLDQKDFLKKYNIDKTKFATTCLKWSELKTIYRDYCKYRVDLESTAEMLMKEVMRLDGVHSVRFRLKDPEHVIEKIIRKKIDNPARNITIDNYKEELTDLIGLRALHLFKEDWIQIHNGIIDKWDTKETPIAYYRDGDREDYLDLFKNNGCELKEHNIGYRSVHYIIVSKPDRTECYAELQVRTIFEEGWSEIDHKIRYPYFKDNITLSNCLMLLNRHAGCADEMSSFILLLKEDLMRQKEEQEKLEIENEKLKNELTDTLKELSISAKDVKKLNGIISKMNDIEQQKDNLKVMTSAEAMLEYHNGDSMFTLNIAKSLKDCNNLKFSGGSLFDYSELLKSMNKGISSSLPSSAKRILEEKEKIQTKNKSNL